MSRQDIVKADQNAVGLVVVPTRQPIMYVSGKIWETECQMRIDIGADADGRNREMPMAQVDYLWFFIKPIR